MDEEKKAQRLKMAKIIAKAWSDGAFKKRLFSEPKAVLEEDGITLPPDLEVQVVEQTDERMYVVLPFKSQDGKRGPWMCEDDAYDLPCAGCD
ncbi:MAG TPA: NHLP leader peptide family RiPP precursor [Syntrophorhabdaceae bacterium]|jgi:hypothetical protein